MTAVTRTEAILNRFPHYKPYVSFPDEKLSIDFKNLSEGIFFQEMYEYSKSTAIYLFNKFGDSLPRKTSESVIYTVEEEIRWLHNEQHMEVYSILRKSPGEVLIYFPEEPYDSIYVPMDILLANARQKAKDELETRLAALYKKEEPQKEVIPSFHYQETESAFVTKKRRDDSMF